MADILTDIAEALQLIVTFDPEIVGIVSRSLLFSGMAVILAILWGTPLAMLIAMKEFRGKTLIKTFLNALIGLPTVVLGLILFLIYARSGLLGFLGLIYTPAAVIIGQAILVTPVLVSIGVSAIESVDPEIMSLSKTLGASESQAQVAVLKEAASGIILSDLASFNRAIGLPTVVLGLILFLIYARSGLLGFLGLIYTPAAVIIGQAILVTPVLVSIGVSAIESVDPEIMSLAKTLGASESQAQVAVLKEAASGIILSDLASFNRAIGELGVVLLVGGNIAGAGIRTDVLTTAISRYVQIGEFGLAIALGILLVLIVFTVNIIVVVARKANYIVELAKAPFFRFKRHRENKQ